MTAHALPALALAACAAALACAPNADDVSTQVTAGGRLYDTRCASCHQGADASGPVLDASLIRSYGTARALFDYTRMAMPWDAPGTLKDEEYWAVTGYLVHSRVANLTTPLDSAAADSVRLIEP